MLNVKTPPSTSLYTEQSELIHVNESRWVDNSPYQEIGVSSKRKRHVVIIQNVFH